MIPALIGKKIGMTRVSDESGVVMPVTVVQAGPCTVLQVRTRDVDGYDAVELGFEDVKPHRSTKPLIGHAAKAGTGPKRWSREVRLSAEAGVARGDVVTVDVFDEEVRFVDVTGVSKGRGFTGVMRRYGFGGQQASHGVERKHRSAGSIGGHAPGATGRGIKKGRKMAGQHGHQRRTSRCQQLVKVDKEHNLLLIKGSVPGPNGGLVFVRRSKTRA
ncbi:MAG: 50S ribosomal protein L3 [Phycisphaerales bacterium]|nr:MAG: 50S ribosomal protein L3 [Phycisphaerales bacterium]